jgi:putative spermidine/putrescine transport system permease protein
MRAVDGRTWLILPAALLLAVAFLVPVGWLLSRAFTFPEPGLQNFALLWERPVYMRVMMNTLMISAIVTPITVLLAFPVAHLMAHGSARLRRWLVFLVLVPF